MKKIKLDGFWFGVTLTISILFVVYCFQYANDFREVNSVGSEVFMIVLPLWIVWRKLQTMGQKIERLKQCNRALAKNML